MQTAHQRRLERLEAQLAPALRHGEQLVAAGVPAERWPDAALDAYCDAHCQHLQHVTDGELEALLASEGA